MSNFEINVEADGRTNGRANGKGDAYVAKSGGQGGGGGVGWCKGAVYLSSPGRPTDIGLQLGKACYPCSG